MSNREGSVPSPLPYLLEVGDGRAANIVYERREMFLLALMAIGCGRTNPLAVAQWVVDERAWLLSKGFGRRKGGEGLPAQATMYRFFWSLEEHGLELEQALQAWAKAVLRVLGRETALLVVNLDGKHLKGSARRGRVDKALVLIAAFLEALGLALIERNCLGDEAKQGRELVMELGGELEGIRWCLTGDAAFAEAALATAVLKKGVTIC